MPPQPEGYGTGPAIAGANDLQAHIDALTHAVEQNTEAVQSSDNGNGTTTTVSQSSQAQGARFTTGSMNAMAAGGNAATRPTANLTGGGSGGGSGGGGILGGGGGGSLLNFRITRTGSLLGGAANFASTLINASGTIGANMLNDALTQNTYGYMTGLGGYQGVNAQGKNYTITPTQAQNALYGTIVNGQVVGGNRLANNTSDAALGGSMLTQLSNNPMFAQTAGTMTNAQAQARFGGYGTSPFVTAAGVGLANPGLGEQGAANVAQALISPTASYNLQMLGVATQPIGIGGKSNTLASVESAIAQRLMGQRTSANGTLNQKQLTTNLNDPLMQYQMMQATGMTADEYQQWALSWEQQNQGALSSGKSLGQVQQGISQFMSGKLTASQLQKQYGVSASAYENTIQSQQSTNMAGENTVNQQFITGLQSATTAVNGLTIIMTGLLAALGGAGAKVSGASAGAGTSVASGVLGSGFGATISEGAALAGVTPSVFSSALGNATSTAIQNMMTSAGDASGAGTGRTTTATGSKVAASGAKNSVSANQAIARSLIAKNPKMKGWGSGQEWNDLVTLWNNESSWNALATNPTSGAFGIAQSLHGNKGGIGGNEYNASLPEGLSAKQLQAANAGDPTAQILWGLNYILNTYGSPSGATSGYNGRYGALGSGYATGTLSARSGLAMVGERGPELVRLSGGQQILSAAQTFNAVQGPYTSANRLMAQGKSSQGGPAVIHVHIEKGAVTMGTNYQGVFTSQDAQAAAAQFEQALSKALARSNTLQALASGITG